MTPRFVPRTQTLATGYVGPKVIAQQFRLSLDCVYDMVKRREIPSVKLSNQLRFKADLADTWFRREIEKQTRARQQRQKNYHEW